MTEQKPKGNGAREVLHEAMGDSLVKLYAAFDTDKATDMVLLKLAEAGFVIKPLEEQ